jgi:hypothetical protein
MILTDYIETPGKGNKKVRDYQNGTRPKATVEFGKLVCKDALRRCTVYLTTPVGQASGVIFGLNKAGNTAYVLTARHVLYSLKGDSDPDDKAPTDYTPNIYQGGIKIKYNPPTLLAAPAAAPAPVSAINFMGLDDTTWKYDIVFFESADPGFVAHATANRLLSTQADADLYGNFTNGLLRAKNNKLPLLGTAAYKLIQLGYGTNVDPDWLKKWSNALLDPYGNSLLGKLQCRFPVATAARVVPGEVLGIDANQPDQSKWQSFQNVCELAGNNSDSSGPGDSGGPVFAVNSPATDKFYLVGVTSGANYFSDKTHNASDMKYENNIVTYWDTLWDTLDWSLFF